MTIVQEAELVAVEQLNKPNRNHIYNRPLFTNGNRREYMLSQAEMQPRRAGNEINDE